MLLCTFCLMNRINYLQRLLLLMQKPTPLYRGCILQCNFLKRYRIRLQHLLIYLVQTQNQQLKLLLQRLLMSLRLKKFQRILGCIGHTPYQRVHLNPVLVRQLIVLLKLPYFTYLMLVQHLSVHRCDFESQRKHWCWWLKHPSYQDPEKCLKPSMAV